MRKRSMETQGPAFGPAVETWRHPIRNGQTFHPCLLRQGFERKSTVEDLQDKLQVVTGLG